MNLTTHTSNSKSKRCARLQVLRLVLVLLAFWAGGGVVTATAEESTVSENQVKAAFLLNFPKYVDWPEESFATPTSPIVVAILGDAMLANDLNKMIAGKTINGRAVVLKIVASEADYTNGCHMLFISATAHSAPAVLSQLQGRSILTVGDEDGFLDQGGIIRFTRRERKIRLEINLSVANQSSLKISSKLLSVADLVKNNSK